MSGEDWATATETPKVGDAVVFKERKPFPELDELAGFKADDYLRQAAETTDPVHRDFLLMMSRMCNG